MMVFLNIGRNLLLCLGFSQVWGDAAHVYVHALPVVLLALSFVFLRIGLYHDGQALSHQCEMT